LFTAFIAKALVRTGTCSMRRFREALIRNACPSDGQRGSMPWKSRGPDWLLADEFVAFTPNRENWIELLIRQFDFLAKLGDHHVNAPVHR